ncbi:hypothetical protein GBAR_LOCUS24807 [Geodia barretti]|uniref:Uncharacterized protein n=1 Tax=Geodia barretti TaxID=519541 RepID=A0AA35TB70_GEOBA|nr:hypothetical protein GBAR_LOCUS24807 [Geodia barretti]
MCPTWNTGESAHEAEVQVGDTVAKVNDTDVRRANAELVQSLISESGDNLQLILVRDAPLVPPDLPPSSVAAAQASSPLRGTSTLPRSHRFPSPSHHTHSHAPSTRHHAPLSSSFSYGALSQDQLPLMAVRSSHQYSSLSHLPRARLATGPQSYGGCSSILSQPPEFDLDPQDQFVHEAAFIRQSSHSFLPCTHMRSVYEEREEDEEEGEGEEEREGRWARPPLPPTQGGGRRGGGERGRSVRGPGEELTQPTYHRAHQNPHPHRHHPPYPPSSSAYLFSQPGDPEVKTTHAYSQVDHAPHHTHHQRKRVDVMTGEHRQFRGPSSFSFSPTHPSYRLGVSNRHHGNVELIGHKPLRPTRSHGYGGEYGNETVPRGQIPYSRIGMGAPANGFSQSPADDSPVEWESLSSTEQKRQKVLQSLVEAESTFHSLLRNGIETYVDPLESVVSSTIHSTLFYNLRELYEVSTRVDLQLKERQLTCVGGATKEATPHYITHIADIYHRELAVLAALLKGYLENLHAAKQELSIAFTNEAFAHLVQKSVIEGKNKSIYSFIESGKDVSQ